MRTIVIITTDSLWTHAKEHGAYTKSTIDSDLADVGFIHCTEPDQTITTANRHFTGRKGIVLLLVNVDKVAAEVKFEPALSGRPGLFPHIYGSLNIDAVYEMVPLAKDATGQFIEPAVLRRLVASDDPR